MLYRVHKRLYVGKGRFLEPGSATRLQWLRPPQIARLGERGAVSEMMPPPLEALPGWGRRAARLAEVGVTDAAQFLDADGEELAQALGVKASTVGRWQAEVMNWLIVDVPPHQG